MMMTAGAGGVGVSDDSLTYLTLFRPETMWAFSTIK